MAQQNFTLSSSNLAGGSYDDETRVLVIEFQGGAQYSYAGVSQDVVEGLRASLSPGSYFYRNIRDVYPHERIG